MKTHSEWYRDTQPQYDSLATLIASTLQSMLRSSQIDFVGVTHRVKSLASFNEKLQRKKYTAPAAEMMDLAGIRVVVFIERDIKKVDELIRHSFNVHPMDSSDKSSSLGEDRFGYRSVHFICDVGQGRVELPEFKPYVGMQFEIQVRTVLQHAWAEIEHDRSYKLAGALPSQLKRRLHLVAGLLELADREFSSLTDEIEQYALEVEAKAQSGKLEKIEINSASIDQLLRHKLADIDHRHMDFESIDDEIVDELKNFGITTLDKLDTLLGNGVLEHCLHHYNNSQGLLRDAMMYEDIDRYFSGAWQGHWAGMVMDTTYHAMLEKYGEEKLDNVVKEYGLDLLDMD